MKRDISLFVHHCVFDENKDVVKVVSGLATDINDMLETGIVRDADISLDQNGIDDPSHIIGIVRDNFDAIEAQRAIKAASDSHKDAKSKAKAAAAAAAAAASVSASAPSNE